MFGNKIKLEKPNETLRKLELHGRFQSKTHLSASLRMKCWKTPWRSDWSARVGQVKGSLPSSMQKLMQREPEEKQRAEADGRSVSLSYPGGRTKARESWEEKHLE